MGVTDDGLDRAANLQISASSAKLRDLALGSSGTAFNDQQAALISELTGGGSDRKVSGDVTRTLQTTNFANDTMRFVATWLFTADKTCQEFGVFTSDNVMFLRDIFALPFEFIIADAFTLTVDVVADNPDADEVGQPSQVITRAGITECLRLMLEGQTGDVWSHIAFDELDTPAAATQTTLADEITANGFSRGAATTSVENDPATASVGHNNVAVISLQRTATGVQGVDGAGVFNAASGGDMLCRFVYRATANFTNTPNADVFTERVKIINTNA